MPDIDEMSTSRYLKKAQMNPTMTLTIDRVIEEDVSAEDKPTEMKWVAYFKEEEKGLVLNMTNREAIARVSGQRNSDNWAGTSITLWNDPSVKYGQTKGGIRLVEQPPTAQPQGQQGQQTQTEEMPF
jgi:hypothetical protein